LAQSVDWLSAGLRLQLGGTGNGRATVKLALLTQLGNENKYYGTDQLGSAIFLAHALLPRDEI